ncbi:MAG TPA: hypothetical protein VFZ65_06025 [Planctomycetota bacterium]|nr:hypothetical protein [Planctomycetota bacterium]
MPEADRNAHAPRPPLDELEVIASSKDLTRQEKIARLRDLCYDAREMDVAAEEGMGGGAPSRFDGIVRLLHQLGARVQPSNTKQ